MLTFDAVNAALDKLALPDWITASHAEHLSPLLREALALAHAYMIDDAQ